MGHLFRLEGTQPFRNSQEITKSKVRSHLLIGPTKTLRKEQSGKSKGNDMGCNQNQPSQTNSLTLESSASVKLVITLDRSCCVKGGTPLELITGCLDFGSCDFVQCQSNTGLDTPKSEDGQVCPTELAS